MTILGNEIEIIAEVKTKSPFGFVSKKSWDDLFKVAKQVGDMISIHTDPRWGGSFDLISKARGLTKKPILAKGIHENDLLVKKAFETGADFVLVVGRVPSVRDGILSHEEVQKCLVEPNTLAEISEIPLDMKMVWNSRDLNTGGLKTETFEQARVLWKGWLCQASNIQTVRDVKKGADAVLVGSHLEEFADSLKKT